MPKRTYHASLETAGYTIVSEAITCAHEKDNNVICTVELHAVRSIQVPATIKGGKVTRKTTKEERKAAIKSALEVANGKSK